MPLESALRRKVRRSAARGRATRPWVRARVWPTAKGRIAVALMMMTLRGGAAAREVGCVWENRTLMVMT